MTDQTKQAIEDSNERFLGLFSKHSDGLKSFVRMLVRDPHDCDDVWQSVSLTLWKKFHTYDIDRPFDKWARGVVVREVLSHRRKSAIQPNTLASDAMEHVLEVFEDNIASQGSYSAMQEALDKCIRALPTRSQHTVSMRYFQLRSHEDIASDLGSTATAARKTLSRIRQRLADCIRTRLAGLGVE